MSEIATLKKALEYKNNNHIEDWIHSFLHDEGNNIPFSEGLRLSKRYYIGPIKMPLSLFKRCCGPEENLKYVIDQTDFERNVKAIQERYKKGWDMPPLIINYVNKSFELTDGNHRYEALRRENIKDYYIIIWITEKEDYEHFINYYNSLTTKF
ncbi:ParB N-terminal domain-containing protein [Mycoplasmatota bacterium]|nr:ParB N-terminal domain-containing protein [Mycoplasmatota bacterium]